MVLDNYNRVDKYAILISSFMNLAVIFNGVPISKILLGNVTINDLIVS